MDETVTRWQLLAFLGELAMWGCAAAAGWRWGWAGAALALLAVLSVWRLWAAPRSSRRLPLAPRLALIAALGLTTAGVLAVQQRPALTVLVSLATVAVVLAQWRDARAWGQSPVSAGSPAER